MPESKKTERKQEKIKVVQLDGLVLLRIIKHCKEKLPEYVTGQLLGLDVEDKLEVTNCFPFPSSTEDDDDNDDYQIEMMKCLRTVNVDYIAVGWYQSAFQASYLNKVLIENQYLYQKDQPNSVVLVYDPFRTTKGSLSLKAFRLTDQFMALYEKSDFSHTAFSSLNVDSSSIMEELPIKVHNSHLVHGFLYELREDGSMSCDFDKLTNSGTQLLEKNLGLLSDCVDEYCSEQQKYQYWTRQVTKQRTAKKNQLDKLQAENEKRRAAGQELLDEDLTKSFKQLPAPSRLETMLIIKQMGEYCEQIGKTSTQGLNKLYISQGFHGSDKKTDDTQPQFSTFFESKE